MALFLLGASQAFAESTLVQFRNVCAPYEKLVEMLDKKYSEQKVGRGVNANGSLIYDLYLSKTGTWSFVVIRPDGTSCIIAHGSEWQISDPIFGEDA